MRPGGSSRPCTKAPTTSISSREGWEKPRRTVSSLRFFAFFPRIYSAVKSNGLYNLERLGRTVVVVVVAPALVTADVVVSARLLVVERPGLAWSEPAGCSKEPKCFD